MKIRTATSNDAAVLTDLAMRSKAHWGYSDAFMAACREELTVSNRKLDSDRYTYRVAESSRRIVGFHAVLFAASNQAELEALFVHPDHMGHGVGRQLLADAVQLAANRGAQRVTIQGDPNAEHFYLAAGARRIGSRESGSIPGRVLPLFEIAVGEASTLEPAT